MVYLYRKHRPCTQFGLRGLFQVPSLSHFVAPHTKTATGKFDMPGASILYPPSNGPSTILNSPHLGFKCTYTQRECHLGTITTNSDNLNSSKMTPATMLWQPRLTLLDPP